MSKSIDSIGPRPDKKQVKPVAEHKAGEVVRPKGAPTPAGEAIKPKNYEPPKKVESNIGVTAAESKQVEKPKKRKRLIRNLGLAALASGLVALFIFGLTQLKPGGYLNDKAYVGGTNDEIVVTRDTAQALKDSLEATAKQENREDFDADAEAEKTIAMWVGLQDQARQLGVQCTGEQRDQFLMGQNKLDQGLDEYYRVNAEAGRSQEVVDFQDDIACLQALMYDKLITQKEYSALTIRWDYFKLQNNNQVDDAAETKILTRMQNEYLPLYQRQANNDEIAAAADDSYIKTDEQRVAIQQNYDGYQSNFRIYKNISQAQGIQPFQQYEGEGEDNFTYINRLTNPGDYTPVFRSSTGYYAIFRLDKVSEGKYTNYDQLVAEYQKPINLSLREDVQRGIKLASTAVWSSVVNVAQAAINCLESPGHRINYYVRVVDVDTNTEVNGLKLTANTDRRNDVCLPVNGGFAGDQTASSGGSFVGGNWHSQSVVDTIDNNEQGAGGAYGYRSDRMQLDCFGPRWRFIPEAPAGYSFVSVTGCHLTYYPCNPLATSVGYIGTAPYFDVEYNSGINGDLFTLVIKVKKNPPPTPLVRFQGYKVNEANNGNGPYAGAQVLIDNRPEFTKNIVAGNCTTANPSAQPYCIDDINASQNHVIRPTGVAGYEIVGYKSGPTGGITPSSQYNYAANSSPNGAVINIWWVYRPIITQTSSVTCTSISGNVSGPTGLPLTTQVFIGTESIGSVASAGFNFNVPDKFRDGISRPVRLLVSYSGGNREFNLGNQVCTRDALCVGTNLSDVFPENRATLSVGESQDNIRIDMKNDGPAAQAIWSTYGTGTYSLKLTPEADVYWDMTDITIPSSEKIYPVPNPINGKSFNNVTIRLAAQPTSNSVPLGFRMAFIPAGGGAPQYFGQSCSTATGGGIRILSSYGPWLRTQNGNVSALGKIEGQEALTAAGGSLGGRRDANVAPSPAVDGQRDDLNFEVTYLVMSHTAGNGPFCSTNAYVLGRDRSDGTSFYPDGCDFDQYKFNLRSGLADALDALKPSEEVVYRNAEDAWDEAPDDCPVSGPATSGSARYKKGLDRNYNGQSLPTMSSACPEITKLTVPRGSGSSEYLTLGAVSNAAASPTSPAIFQPTGRMTIIVEDDLYLNANIINTPKDATFNRDDLIGLNALPNLGIVVKGDIIIDKDVTRIDASLYASGKIRTCEEVYGPGEPGLNNSSISNGYKPEVLSGATVQQNSEAARCRNQLSVRGLMASKGGFMLGRNFVDFSAIQSQTGRPQFSADFDYDPRRSLYYGRPAEDVIFNGLVLIAPPPGFEHLTKPDFFQARYVTDDADPRF